VYFRFLHCHSLDDYEDMVRFFHILQDFLRIFYEILKTGHFDERMCKEKSGLGILRDFI